MQQAQPDVQQLYLQYSHYSLCLGPNGDVCVNTATGTSVCFQFLSHHKHGHIEQQGAQNWALKDTMIKIPGLGCAVYPGELNFGCINKAMMPLVIGANPCTRLSNASENCALYHVIMQPHNPTILHTITDTLQLMLHNFGSIVSAIRFNA